MLWVCVVLGEMVVWWGYLCVGVVWCLFVGLMGGWVVCGGGGEDGGVFFGVEVVLFGSKVEVGEL